MVSSYCWIEPTRSRRYDFFFLRGIFWFRGSWPVAAFGRALNRNLRLVLQRNAATIAHQGRLWLCLQSRGWSVKLGTNKWRSWFFFVTRYFFRESDQFSGKKTVKENATSNTAFGNKSQATSPRRFLCYSRVWVDTDCLETWGYEKSHPRIRGNLYGCLGK